MRTFVLLTIVGTILCPVSESIGQHMPPAFEWVKRVEAQGGTYGWSIHYDPTGELKVVGETASSVDLGVTNIVETVPGSGMGMLVQLDTDGRFTRGIGLTGEGNAQVTQVQSANGRSIIAGTVYSRSNTDFGGVTLPPTNSQNGFVASYTRNNELEWVLRAETASIWSSVFFDLKSLSDGSVVAAGFFLGPFLSIGGTNLSGQLLSQNAMLVKINEQGAVDWATSFGGTGAGWAFAVSSDNEENIYVSGMFERPTLVAGETTLTNEDDNPDGFVAKLNSLGEPQWAVSVPSDGWTLFVAMAVDPDTNEIVVTGTKNFPGPGMKMLTQKYRSDGSLVWEIEADELGFNYGHDVTIDGDGNVFVCGSSGMGGTIWKLNPDGDVLWKKYVTNGGPNDGTFQSIALGPDDSLYLSIYFGAPALDLAPFLIQGITGSPTTVLAKLAADPPALRHQLNADRLVLSWPTNQTGFQLEASSLSLDSLDWFPVSSELKNGRNIATNSLDQPNQFFRLRKEME